MKREDFKPLAENTKKALEAFKTTCKENILKTVGLEIQQTKDDIIELFCKATHKLASSILVELNPHSINKKYIRILSLMCIQKNPNCLNRTGMDRVTFYETFKEHTLDELELFNGSNNNYTDQNAVDELILYDKLRLLLSNAFHVPLEKLLKVHHFKTTEKQLVDLFTNGSIADKTAEMSM